MRKSTPHQASAVQLDAIVIDTDTYAEVRQIPLLSVLRSS